MPAAQPLCIICRKKVSNKETKGSICCCVCERWSHTECTKLKPAALEYFNDMYETNGFHFYSCDGCARGYQALNKRVAEMEMRMNEVVKDVEKNTRNVKDNTERIDRVEQTVDTVKETIKSTKDDTVMEATKAWSKELRDREQRKTTIVMYGVTEHDPAITNGQARKEHDTTMVENIMYEIGADVVLATDAKFTIRMGKLSPEAAAKPRPIRINLRWPELVEKIFDKARKLPSTQYKEISIVPDLTDLQREEDRDLTKEAEELNAGLDEDESLNWEYRCFGRRGLRTISKVKKRSDTATRGGRGRGRGQGWNWPPPHHSHRQANNQTTTTTNRQRETEEADERRKRNRSPTRSLLGSPTGSQTRSPQAAREPLPSQASRYSQHKRTKPN